MPQWDTHEQTRLRLPDGKQAQGQNLSRRYQRFDEANLSTPKQANRRLFKGAQLYPSRLV